MPPLQAPLKLLEINIISAHDLPPVSKMLRTFAVAYIYPEHKLTTRIDHQGNTNPTWNYKLSFHIDDRFLKNESSAVTIEIYNLAWLRDLPIGTARLFIHNLSPPIQKNGSIRRVALQVCRPSGHLRGTLNLGVQLVDNPDSVSGSETSTRSLENEVQYVKQQGRSHGLEEEFRNLRSRNVSICASPGMKTETKTFTSSPFSVMQPLPSKVATDLKWNDHGSSIFDDWTERGGRSEDHELRSTSLQWRSAGRVPLTDDKKSGSHGEKKRGLLSCFGNAAGFEFSIICGSRAKKKKKNRYVNKPDGGLMSLSDVGGLMSLSDENLHRFYI